MSGSSIAFSVSRKRKRTPLDDPSPSHKSAKRSFGIVSSSSEANSQLTLPIRKDEELGNQLRTGCDALYDGDVERQGDERQPVEARQNQEPPASNNSGAFVISPALHLEVPFQFSTHTSRQPGLSTAPRPIEVYHTTPPTTPSRPLRSPNAVAIWAGIVGVPPPLPNFSESTSDTQLPPADPICLLSMPKMDHVWNNLPTGTFWEFARFAQDENLDANETMLVTALIGDTNTRKRSNVEGVEAIRSWDNGSKLSEEDSYWLQELDWEAEAIVEDKGRMLGIGVDGDMGENTGTRYGGRVGFCATLHCEERQRSATLNLKIDGRIILEKPMMRGSCLFTRIWGSHRFLRLKLSERLLNRVSKDETGQLRKELQGYCSRPIHILGRKYHPLFEKEGTVYYFQHGHDRVGLRAIEGLGGTRKDYGVGRYIGTVGGLLQWWLVPEHNRNQAMSKLTTRLHLGLSDTLPGVFIKPENVKITPDITRNGFEFTDGAGLASGSVAIACWRKYHPGDYLTPPALQIRLSSAKGVVQVDPKDAETSNFNGPFKITLAESMVKVRYNPKRRPAKGPVHGMSIYDAAHYIVCIVKPAPMIYPSRLSGQYMTILSARGVPDEVFLELQQDSVEEALKVIGDVHKWWDNGSQSRAGVNGRMQLAAALETAGGLAISMKKRDTAGAARGLGFWRAGDDRSRRKGTQDRYSSSRAIPAASPDEPSQSTGISGSMPAAIDIWRRDEVSGYPPLKYEALRVAALQGLDIARSNHFSSLWAYIVHDVIRGVVLDLHLPVARSAGGFLQPDWTGTLQEGEIVFIPAEGVRDPDTGFVPPAIVGDVVVGRHPAHLPTDMRKVRAINPPPELRHCRGLIIFSTQGSRPLADILAGGDYDGDLGDVIWEPKIVNAFQNAPLELSKAPPNVDSCFERDTVSVNELLERFKYIPEQYHIRYFSQHLLSSIGEPGLFRWYSGMYNKAAIQYGVDHSITQDLAHKFNKLMDAEKSGIRIKPSNFRHDKTHWDKTNTPYWKHQQRLAKPGTYQDPDSSAMCYSASASRFILDVLVDVGSGLLKGQVETFKAQLQIYHNAEFNSRCQSGTQDEDLTRPWFEALSWAADEPDRATREAKQAELGLIQTSVNTCLNRFMQTVAYQIQKKTSRNQRQEDLSALVRHYANSPDLQSLPLLTTLLPGGDARVGRIKASCAYLRDSERYQANKGLGGGSPSGFPWQMAMAELGNIKAEAISRGDTLRLPYNVVERVGVHRHFK